MNVIWIIPLRLGVYTIENMYLWIFLAFLAITFFIIPQITIHKTLKTTKEKIIETFDRLQDKTREDLGDHVYLNEAITSDEIDLGLKKLEYIKNSRDEIKKLGTWAYDFPEVLKLVGVASLSAIPLLIEFLPIF